MTVLVLFVLGGKLLLPGLLLALLLLLTFSGALISVLARRIQTSCNCFGSGEKQVTQVDIWRNAVLVLCTCGGCILALQGTEQWQPGVFTWLLIGGVATVFVLIASSFDDIVRLLR